MKYVIITLLLLSSGSIIAQDVSPIKQREIGLSIGIRKMNVKDLRFSNRVKQTSLLSLGFFHERKTNASRLFTSARFAYNMNPTSGTGIRYGLINPDVAISYQRKVNQLWVGPSITHQTIVNLPQNTYGMFNNNPVSYTGVTSLGVAMDHTLSIKNSSFVLNSGLRYALISHVIRPAFAHPYPEDFLREEVFDPTRAGIANSVARSGKIKSIKGLQSIRVRIGFSYEVNQSFKLGLLFESELIKVNEHKSITSKGHDLLFTVSHIY